MDDFKRYNELLDNMIEHVKNNNGENQILDYNTSDVREIRIKVLLQSKKNIANH